MPNKRNRDDLRPQQQDETARLKKQPGVNVSYSQSEILKARNKVLTDEGTKAFVDMMQNLSQLSNDLKRVQNDSTKTLIQSLDEMNKSIAAVKGVSVSTLKTTNQGAMNVKGAIELTPDMLRILAKDMENVVNKITRDPKIKTSLSTLNQTQLNTFTQHLKAANDAAQTLQKTVPKAEQKVQGFLTSLVSAVLKICKVLTDALGITKKAGQSLTDTYKQYEKGNKKTEQTFTNVKKVQTDENKTNKKARKN